MKAPNKRIRKWDVSFEQTRRPAGLLSISSLLLTFPAWKTSFISSKTLG